MPANVLKRVLYALVALGMAAAPARAYIDVSPTLGRLINDSSNVVVLRVEKVSREKRIIVFQKVADLKGKDPEGRVKHQLSDGFHPREPATILDWAEPGQLAVAFHNGKVAQVCIGKYWYECAAREGGWWVMTCGQSQLCFAYRGSTPRLSDHVRAMLEGKEVVITAIRYGADDDYWEACRRLVASRGLPEGKEFPLCRFKASLRMPSSLYSMARDPHWTVQTGAAGAEDVPALLAALRNPDPGTRAEAAESLLLVEPAATNAVPALLQALDDPQPRVRVRVALALARIDPGRRPATDVLVRLLQDGEASVRRDAAQALRHLDPDAVRSAVPVLDKALADPDHAVRRAAAEALGHIGPHAAAAVPALCAALRQPDAAVRGSVIDALGAVGRKAQAAVPLLVETLQDQDGTLRWAAASALGRIDRDRARAALPLVLNALKGSESRLRWHALSLLRHMDVRAKQAVPPDLLLEALRDPDIGVRGRAAGLLGEAGARGEAVVAGLTAALDDEDGWVRTASAAALVKVAGRKATAAVPALIEGVADEDADIRENCLVALATLGPAARPAVPALSRATHHKDARQRLLAAEALVRVSGDARAAAPTLRAALGDPSPEVRVRAAETLGRIGREAAWAVPALLPLLEDEAGDVREAAAEALGKVDPAAAARVLPAAEADRGGLARGLGIWACLCVALCLPIAFRRLARD